MHEQQDLSDLRRGFHQLAEKCGQERRTSQKIIQELEKYASCRIIKGVGGFGVVAIFEGAEPGQTVLVRSDIDALPIDEGDQFPHASQNAGVSHKCGHDGHLTILLGVAAYFHRQPIRRGRVILLFQPSEENGQGAEAVLQDEKFACFKLDYVFALHNLPGFELNEIVVREGVFSIASTGLLVNLIGKESHASEPEKGNNPSVAAAEMIKAFSALPKSLKASSKYSEDLIYVTNVHTRIGSLDFGLSPGVAEVGVTLRASSDLVFQRLQSEMLKIIESITKENKLRSSYQWVEHFPALVNDKPSIEIIQQAANAIGLEVKFLEKPFTWSEDFSQFTKRYQGAMFGLGAGEKQAPLHSSEYDFPDELLETGSQMFIKIIERICENT